MMAQSAGPSPSPDPVPPARRRPPSVVTWSLVAANVAVFLLEIVWGGSQSARTLVSMGAALGRGAILREPWRILSSAFLHIGPVHILVNMWALVTFGRLLERALGPRRYLVFYGLCAAAGGLAYSLAHERTLAAGASGAIWGLMVGDIAMILRLRHELGPERVPVQTSRVLQPLVVNLLYSLLPGISMAGHLGGGIAGGALILTGWFGPRRREGPGWTVAAGVAGLVMAGCVVMALLHGRPWELQQVMLTNSP
jgi:membrane associated rhomboid family serine protease